MSTTAQLKNVYAEQIAPALMKQFNYSSPMQIPVLKKIVVNQGLGMATADKKVIEVAMNEIAQITGQKPVATKSKKDISNLNVIDPKTGKPTRIGRKKGENGKLVRYAKKSGEEL